MATNTAALKTFAQQTRRKLVSLVTTKMQYLLNADTAELRGYASQINDLRRKIEEKTESIVIEEVAYTWFNRIMALRFMDANGYNAPMVVTPAPGQMRPEILQDAMGGTVDDSLGLTSEEKLLPEEKLYRQLLIAVCDKQMAETMPFLFEKITDYTELLLPDDLLSDQSFVTDIRNGMTDEDCQNVEIMGWLYQFYITDRKADAETKKSRKGGLKSDEQAAATQLFTPHWIVRYMVENSLGRIWMTLHKDSKLIDDMPYYIKPEEGQEDTIPDDIHSVRDIRFADICTGSGHVLVYAFDLFTKMYEEEGVLHKDIPALILQNNLYGIDIDRRCAQLASFALTMKARAYYSRYLRHSVMPNVIALQPIDYDTIESTGAWPSTSLMWQFQYVDTIGSLLKITPKECNAIQVGDGLRSSQQKTLKTQAEYLSRHYHCVVTNPPYLGKGIGDNLKSYVQRIYPNSKSDLMATFMERAMDFLVHKGRMAMINMHSWMFIASYEHLREALLENYKIESLLHLGPHTFDELGGEIVQNAAFVFLKPNNIHDGSVSKGTYFNLTEGINCSDKEKLFLNASTFTNIVYNNVEQNNFKEIPASVIGYWATQNEINTYEKGTPISDNAEVRVGMHTGSNDLFVRSWYEIDLKKIGFTCKSHQESLSLEQYKWYPYNKGGGTRKWYGFRDNVVNWWKGGVDIHKFHNIPMSCNGAPVRAKGLQFKESGTWSFVSSGSFSIRYSPSGSMFDVGGSSLFSKDVKYIVGFLCSKVANDLLKIENPTMNFQVGNISDLPLIIDKREVIEDIVNSSILISQLDWDAHETSWDFQTNELVRIVNWCLGNGQPRNFSISAIINIYESEWDEHFIQLHGNEEELNRQFIEIYGLQDELTPDVPLDEVTILQKGEISIDDTAEHISDKIVWHEDVVIKQFLSYLVGCFMGRYSVDKPGLIIASQGQDLTALGLKIDGMDNTTESTLSIDDDGIIPIIQEAEFFADDMTWRVENAIERIFGKDQFYENMKYIKAKLGMDLREYFFKDFYADHLQMYSVKGAKRPIYWLFSSKMGDKKKKGYFKALVYMHRMEPDTLSKLHADYVHPYLTKIEQQLIEAEDETTRDDLSQAQRNKALKLVEELRDKVREVKAFETQLVEMASHRMSIDLDDGVKTNYPNFYPLVEPIKGLENSGD